MKEIINKLITIYNKTIIIYNKLIQYLDEKGVYTIKSIKPISIVFFSITFFMMLNIILAFMPLKKEFKNTKKFTKNDNSNVEPILKKECFIEFRNNRENILKNKYKVSSLTHLYSFNKKTKGDVVLDINEYSTNIANKFIEEVLTKHTYNKKVLDFLNEETIRFSILEQTYSSIPASIKLAQAIVETGYGKKIPNNNYFGIKDKTNKGGIITTREWFTEKETYRYRKLIIEKTGNSKIVNGELKYECLITDSFCNFNTKWESFRFHSKFLRGDKRYAELFQKGQNDYKQWAFLLQENGYATSPIYAETIIKVIEKYNLHLLD